MANLTFADLENECYAHLGLDSADATNQANVDRWLNYTQQDICSQWPWSFMESRESIVTVPDYSTGTVSVPAGSATVTGVGTTFTAVMGAGQYYIQFAGANDWYKITARASNTSITIEQPYQPTTNASGAAFIVRKRWYSLSSACDRILDIVNWNTPVKLVEVDPRTVDDFYANPQSTNSTYAYFPYGVDSSGNIQISPYPFPSDARLLEIKTRIRPTDGSISIPNKYAMTIAWGALSVGFAYLRKFDMAQAWNAKYMAQIAMMKKMMGLSTDYQPILRSIDSGQQTRWIQLPPQYPGMNSGA